MTKSKLTKTRSSIRLPADLNRSSAALMDQQMWCWGCDVRRTAGNLLLAYGADKRSSPDPRYQSAYTFRTITHIALTLWGWGLWCACSDKGSLFVSRSHLRLRYSRTVTLTPDAWRERDLPATVNVQGETTTRTAYVLLADALQWIGHYEYWLRDQVEPDYRERVIARWPQCRQYKGVVPAAEMADRWFELSTIIQKELAAC
jgi:hypothetical protein